MDRKILAKQYYQANKEYYREYYKKNRERITAYRRKRRQELSELQKYRNEQIKIEVFSHYSHGKPKCTCCGENNIVFLTIDHINGGGRKHIKPQKELRGGNTFYRWLKNHHYPKGFQVLCYNCNCAKRISKVCPHQIK